jgi:hypothetical protein
MPVPSYLTDQNEDYITSRGYSFKQFSAEQILDELRMRDISISLHGLQVTRETYDKEVDGKKVKTKYTTIVDGVPHLGSSTRWAILTHPFTRQIYRCVRLRSGNRSKQDTLDFRKSKRKFRAVVKTRRFKCKLH